MQATADRLDREITGLDALELAGDPGPSLARRAWSATWPKVLAAAIALFAWQCVVWSGWNELTIPSPAEAWDELRDLMADGTLQEAVANTLTLGFSSYLLALVIGVVLGCLVARIAVLRAAIGSAITGLQTLPSIAWFPLALPIFGLNDAAVRFVVVMGAAPSIANGLIAGIDTVPPILTRAGRALGARGLAMYRYVLLPASMPSFVAGLKQGWAFAWRSLMAGELLNSSISSGASIGELMENMRSLSNFAGIWAIIVVILFIGIVIDAVLFAGLERSVRRRWGLLAPR
jgi:NitT/TauT family transport system permease protein